MSLFSATDPALPVARALVVTPVFDDGGGPFTPGMRSGDARLDEAMRLTRGIGVAVPHGEIVGLAASDTESLVGRKGVDRLGGLMEAFQADLLVVDHPLTSMQQRILERGCLAKVIDRPTLILEAMGVHAATPDERIQAELAALLHQRSRHARGWTSLGKRRTVLGFQTATGGVPGDTLLERHRRLLTEHIAGLKHELAALRRLHARQRAARRADGSATVALIGYAGAGVSTLRDQLCAQFPGKNAASEWMLPSGRTVALVEAPPVLAGWPHSAVNAFGLALDAVRDADLILHVQDLTGPEKAADKAANKANVDALLTELGIDPATDPRLMAVLNKADRLAGTARAALALRFADHADAQADGRGAVVSASTRMGLAELADGVERRLDTLLPVPPLRADRPALA